MNLSIVVAPAATGEHDGLLTQILTDYARVSRRDLVATLGNDDLADSAESCIIAYREQARRHKKVLLAVDGAQVVGGAWFSMPLTDNLSAAQGDFVVDPLADPTVVMPALWERAAPLLSEAGRSTVQLWSAHPLVGPSAEQLVPRTGVGHLALDPVGTTLRALGFTLEQVERHSMMDVREGMSLAHAALPGARRSAGSAYRTLSWVGATPPEHREAMAALMARMSTDVPSGELEIEAEVWDADRVADRDRVALSMGRIPMCTVAQEASSGQLVAYTYLEGMSDKPAVIYQEDTLVHAEHRGHRLGMLVKAQNLLEMARYAPQARRVHTWNAGENHHMLAINTALGFRVSSVEGAWQFRQPGEQAAGHDRDSGAA